METIKFGIDGMHCQSCVGSVTKALRAVAGVKSTQVSLDAAVAEVAFDPAMTAPAALEKAIVAAGYTVRTGAAAAEKAAPVTRCGGDGGQGKTGCGCG